LTQSKDKARHGYRAIPAVGFISYKGSYSPSDYSIHIFKDYYNILT